ncbi:MAG: ribbon-helix-helix protein, CopG family [Chthoniobacteraceae bacterium]
MALDSATLRVLNELAKLWGVSKSEVMRRAVRQAKMEADKHQHQLKPQDALDWLQKGGGLSVKEAGEFREEVRAERDARRQWWEG